MPLSITLLFGGLFGLMYLALAVRVSLTRKRVQAPLGDKGDRVLHRAVRAHGNFAEYAPFGLLLLALNEYHGASSTLVWILGGALMLGRILHAWGISHEQENLLFRMSGMAMTYLTFLALSVNALILALG